MLTPRTYPAKELSMAGYVRTKEKCPRCGSKFAGEPLRCSICLTVPRRYFLDLVWPGHGRIKIYSGKDGHPLDSYERAFRLLTAIRHEIDNHLFDPRNYVKQEAVNLQFDIYSRNWLKRRHSEVEKGLLSRQYYSKLVHTIDKYLIPFFERRSIREITEGQIEDLRDALPTHLSPKTIANVLGILHKILADAFRRRDISRLPDFPRIPLNDPVTRWLAPEEQEMVLGQVKNPVHRALFIFLIYQGCRPGEARALKWEDIDFRRKIVVIRAAMDKDTYRPYTKERDVRYLPLHLKAEEALKSLPRSISGFVFTKNGKPLRQQLVSDSWREAAKRAGIKATCYQGTRHSLASQAINQGVPQSLIGKFLGHKDSRSTERYTHLLTESLKMVWGPSPESVPDLSPEEYRKPNI